MPLDKISNTYSKIVLGYLLKFCSEYSEKSIKTFRESVEIYTSLPPSLVGRLGCNWMNEDVIAWSEIFFCVKLFICCPGLGDTNYFRPADNLMTMDFKEDPDDPNDFYFRIKENKITPTGLVVLVFEGSHYYCVLRNAGCDCPFYQIGGELPGMLYKALNITKELWEDKLILSTINKHNESVVKNGMVNASDATKELPKYILLQFNSPKLNYSFEDLSKILYPFGLPNEM